MKDRNFAIAYLKAMEKKHQAYFVAHHLSIMQCVEIEGANFACIHVTKDDLPPEIRYDIEIMFWRTEPSTYALREKHSTARFL
ncbi:MAG: hypothetical protein NVS3B13_36070 [Mucilaginibacter sp.]